MARNDLILIDGVINASKETYGEQYDKSEIFELFSFDQILKNYDLSFEEIEVGWVDGQDDAGIDGLFLFLDKMLVNEKPKSKSIKNEPLIELIIVNCKHKDSFKQEPVTNLLSTIPEFLDLTKENDDLIADYNESLLNIRQLFKDTYIECAIKRPTLKIHFYYVCRGDSKKVADNIENKKNLLIENTEDLFANSKVSFDFVGASELLEMHRTKKDFSLRLKFIENTISRANTNYIALSKVGDFYNFITDENSELRRYLFESNVRDYIGASGVNLDIEKTLVEQKGGAIDFWWLNNGITIIASNVNVAGKELALENIQIVNGLQTTETIYKYFSSGSVIEEDDRAVLIKVIVAEEESIRDQIIRATNNQSPVDVASLRAMDKIQRDIEHILLDNDLYYDRRKNYYRNQGKPATKIVSLFYLSGAIQAMCLGDLNSASRLRTRFFRDEAVYDQIFNQNWSIEVFLKATQIQRKVDELLSDFHFNNLAHPKVAARQYKFFFSYMFTCQELSKIYFGANEVLKIDLLNLNMERIGSIWQFIRDGIEQFLEGTRNRKGYVKRPHRNQPLHNFMKQKLTEQFE